MPAWTRPVAADSVRRPALFLDRDGVVIRDCHYLADPGLVDLLPGVAEVFAGARAAGFRVIGLSNQSGLGRGLITPEAFAAVTDRLVEVMAEVDAVFDDFLYCPHAPDEGCRCRKPRPGLLVEAGGRSAIDLPGSWMVGDKVSDIALGRDAGLGAILVRTGYGAESEADVLERWADDPRVHVVDDLAGVWPIVSAALDGGIRMSWLLDGQPMRRILVSRLRYLGDVVMSTVVLEVLRQGDPALRLGYLCEAEHGGVLAGHPLLDRLHLLDSRRKGADERARVTRHSDRLGDGAQGFWGTVRDLRAEKYDLAVDLFFNPRSAWLLRLGGPVRRIGGTTGSRRHLYSHLARPEDLSPAETAGTALTLGALGHHLSRLAPLVHRETGLGFTQWLRVHGAAHLRPTIPASALTRETRAALSSLGLDADRPFILLAPGATWPSKEWPLSRWVDLVRQLRVTPGLPLAVLVPPGRGDDWQDLAAAVQAADGVVLPPLALDQALAMVGQAEVLVSVDGGVMHAGVGLGTPTVGIFGPTDPALWFPYEDLGPFRVVVLKPDCHPCDRHTCDAFICLPDLAAEKVGEAVAAVRPGGG